MKVKVNNSHSPEATAILNLQYGIRYHDDFTSVLGVLRNTFTSALGYLACTEGYTQHKV